MYVIVNRHGKDSSRTSETARDEARLIEAVEPELSVTDGLTVIKKGNFTITLGATTEFAAMRIARLARNAFQQLYLTSQHESLSIGVVLHGPQAPEPRVLLLTAQSLAGKAHKTVGNNIELLVLHTSWWSNTDFN